jgi:hypothetical protein
MEASQKPRVVTDYEKLNDSLVEQIKLYYPYGFSEDLISFPDKEGKMIKGLRFESDEKIYLIRMTVSEAEEIIEEDDDYDDEGNLLDDIREEYEDKHGEED